MKKNNILLFGILIVLVLVYLSINFFDDGGRSKSFRAELVDFNKDQVTRIEIESAGSSTLLSGGPDDWQVQLSDGTLKPAKKGSINSMLSSLVSIEPSRIASRSEDEWTEYMVDETGTRVTVYEDDNKSLDIMIGRFGMEGQQSFYTFVRLTDENDTYVANNFMSMSVSKDANSFRNDVILRLKKDSLNMITFDYPDTAFTMSLSGDKWYIDSMEADSSNVVSYLSGLNFLSSANFAESSGDPLLKATFTTGGQDDAVISLDRNNTLSSSFNTFEVFSDSVAASKVFKGKSYFLP